MIFCLSLKTHDNELIFVHTYCTDKFLWLFELMGDFCLAGLTLHSQELALCYEVISEQATFH